jgi:hypothetical protein
MPKTNQNNVTTKKKLTIKTEEPTSPIASFIRSFSPSLHALIFSPRTPSHNPTTPRPSLEEMSKFTLDSGNEEKKDEKKQEIPLPPKMKPTTDELSSEEENNYDYFNGEFGIYNRELSQGDEGEDYPDSTLKHPQPDADQLQKSKKDRTAE